MSERVGQAALEEVVIDVHTTYLCATSETVVATTGHRHFRLILITSAPNMRYERAVEAEEYQAVGMQLRECLVALGRVMQRHVELPEGIEKPKGSDFKGWSTVIHDQLCPGPANQELRQYLKTHAEKTWSLVSSITHDTKANDTATVIALEAVENVIGDSIAIVMRARRDKAGNCPSCSSRKIRTHYDNLIGENGDYFETCGVCDWSSHPGYDYEEPAPVPEKD